MRKTPCYMMVCALAGLLAAPVALATSARADDVRQDRRDIRQDERDIQRDASHERHEMREGDARGAAHAVQQERRDQEDLARDQRDLARDREARRDR